jgi:hypothetical protein
MEEEIKTFTTTTNGALAYSPGYFLETEEKSLFALSAAIVTKDDFANAKQYLDKIFKGDNKLLKMYAMVLVVHFRDIEFGKGLRKPFLEGIMYLYEKGYKEFVKKMIPHIPEYGYFKDLCQLFAISEKQEYEELKTRITETYTVELKKEFEGN